jgi:5'-deoxynucleotidase YfbR-like HD superfamily hydrolase
MSSIKTYTGVMFDPVHPESERIDILDIAHALSMLCRANGHFRSFYSVGQHCINCAKEAKARGWNERLQLGCLLHDAAEAYMSDLITPIKVHMPRYYDIEDRFLKAVYEKFNLADLTKEEWDRIMEVDRALLIYDLVELLKEPVPEEGYQVVRVPDIAFRPFEEVEEEYKEIALALLNELKA